MDDAVTIQEIDAEIAQWRPCRDVAPGEDVKGPLVDQLAEHNWECETDEYV